LTSIVTSMEDKAEFFKVDSILDLDMIQ